MPSSPSQSLLSVFAFLSAIININIVAAFNANSNANLAVYWGQDSIGAVTSKASVQQARLSSYCTDDSVIDTFPLAFLTTFFDKGGLPSMDFSNICSTEGNAPFSGTNLPDCSFMASDIKACQAQGKTITISLGGATGSVGFSSDSQAETFAQTIWDLFLGGSSSTRPFGDAVLDGIDLDIEAGSSTGYAAFVTKIRSLSSGASKKYYVTGAPQCPFPDAQLGSTINAVGFDAVYVQFYNNYCGLDAYGSSDWNFATWDNWAKKTSPNKNVKVYIGAPASSSAAGTGYVSASQLAQIVQDTQAKYSSFGGVMLWDVSQAYANNRFDQAVKSALTKNGNSGSSSSSSSVVVASSVGSSSSSSHAASSSSSHAASSSSPHAVSSSSSHAAASSTPAASPTASSTRATSSSRSTSSTRTSSSSFSATASPTSNQGNASPSGGVCSGVAAWSSRAPYIAGSTVTFNGKLWSNSWWSYSDQPGGSAGVWVQEGSCGSTITPVATTSSAKLQNHAAKPKTTTKTKKSKTTRRHARSFTVEQ